jgi:galactokinase
MPDQPSIDLRSVVHSAFVHRFGAAPTVISRAPGRVNIIGEHTDYNDGFVLPAAIQQAITIAGRLRDDRQVTIESLDYHEVASFTLDQLRDETLPSWTRYLRGVLVMLAERGAPLRGMQLTIVGNVPREGGFSSSAAVEVAMIEIASALLGVMLSQPDKALLGVRVENDFVGVPTGIMDQMISALGKTDHALLLDCREYADGYHYSYVQIPAGVSLLACDTTVRRRLANTGENQYAIRRQQAEQAAHLLGVSKLRDVTSAQLAANADKLPDVVRNRAMHVVHENERTLQVVDALRRGDLVTAGRLINDGHTSLSKLYEVSIPELDIMAEIAQAQPGCYGARMMGGGFGGAVIALVRDDAVGPFSAAVAQEYDRRTGITAVIHRTKAGPGSGVEWVS